MDINTYQQKSSEIIEKLTLEPYEKDQLYQSWLLFIIHLEHRVKKNYKLNKWLSIIGIVGGITIPAINSFLIEDSYKPLITSVLGVITATSIAINQSLKHNEKWRHFRKMTELCRIEGEKYFALAGQSYQNKTHREAFPFFITNLADLKNIEIHTYFDNIDGLTNKTK